MKSLDLTMSTPEENLACDEALLDLCEASGEGTLRLWESPRHFVVVGYANRVEAEADRAACAAAGVPVLRRCSGGGTVLQGPGCLNYSLALPFGDTDPLATIQGTNRFIMERHRAVLEKLLGNVEREVGRVTPCAPSGGFGLADIPTRSSGAHGVTRPTHNVTVEGHTDLAVNGLKFSGNAQRRKRRALIFHGTFLHDFDLSLIGKYLRFPSQQPDYRQGRAHGEFVTNLGLDPALLRAALRECWAAHEPLVAPPVEKIAALVREKYSKAEWNGKF